MAGKAAPIRGATAPPKENKVAKKLPSVLLRAGEDRRVRAGHPWAFSNEILMDAETKALPAGLAGDLARAGRRGAGRGDLQSAFADRRAAADLESRSR